MKRRGLALLVALVALVGGTGAVTEPESVAAVVPVELQMPEPHEEDPGFDCRIHGNKTCGPAYIWAA